MPNTTITNMMRCFGLDCINVTQNRNTQRPRTNTNRVTNHTPTPPRPVAPQVSASYMPGRFYTIAELDRFATSNRPSAINREHFLVTLVQRFTSPETSRPDKATLCKHLANLMTDEDAFECQGAERQANYFASYCVDLTLQELDNQYSAGMEETLRNMLSMWINNLCPSQSDFNLNGVIYPRQDLLQMLASQKLINTELRAYSSELAQQVEARLHGRGNFNNRQNVHDAAVRGNAARVLDIMDKKSAGIDSPNNRQITAWVNKLCKNHPNSAAILAGLQKSLHDHRTDSAWSVNVSPFQTLTRVTKYIWATKDQTLKQNLTDSLLTRLREISNEDPCITGVLQRLIDVPNGIDPDMGFINVSDQIAQEMSTVASKAFDQFTNLIDEGLNALPLHEINPEPETPTVEQIGRQMFATRVHQEMHQLGGIPEEQLTQHIKNLETGFTLPS